MNENKKWYAVYTRPRWEKKVTQTLSRKKYETYCPLNKVLRQWSDRKKIVHEPLFISYVFVRATESELKSIKDSNGVINLVYWLGKPAIIRDSEIETIKKFLSEHVNIKLEKTPINTNDTVRIIGGPLIEMEGKIISIRNRTVKMLLPSLGYMMYAEIDIKNIKVILPKIPENQDFSARRIAINE